MNEYLIRYRVSYVSHEGWMAGGSVESKFRCKAKSKVEALMLLVNLDAVYEVISVKRIK